MEHTHSRRLEHFVMIVVERGSAAFTQVGHDSVETVGGFFCLVRCVHPSKIGSQRGILIACEKLFLADCATNVLISFQALRV